MKLSRLEALLAEAKKDPAITGDTDLEFRIKGYAGQATDAMVTIREVIAQTVGDGIPAIRGAVPGSVGSGETGTSAPVVTPDAPLYRQPKMLVIEGV